MNSEKLEKEIQILRNVYNELKNVSDFQKLRFNVEYYINEFEKKLENIGKEYEKYEGRYFKNNIGRYLHIRKFKQSENEDECGTFVFDEFISTEEKYVSDGVANTIKFISNDEIFCDIVEIESYDEITRDEYLSELNKAIKNVNKKLKK